MMFESGQEFGHFKIVRKLGEGGMGEVYLAEDQKLNRNVALKILHPEFFDNQDRMERFNREAKTAAQISHPNVMSIYDIGTATDERSQKEVSYIVMEFVSGQSLTDYLRNRNPELKDLLRLSERVASGLAGAHKLNIVHRDIKTDNIMIDESGEPKILDFGLAKPVASTFAGDTEDSTQTVSQALTREGKILGTVTYMSPEQARGEQVDARSDVFSFGIMLYKMVAGDFPFKGSDPVSTMAKILEARQIPLTQANDTLPPELERIVDKCLQKDPDDRYQDTRDLVVDIRNLRRQYESGISDTSSVIAKAPPRRKKEQKHWLTWPKLVFLGLLSLPILAIIASMFSDTPGVVISPSTPKSSQAADDPGAALAILGFENKTGDEELDWLTAGLPEILLTDLAQHGQMRLISRNRVLDCLSEDETEITNAHAHDKCVAAAKSLGAGSVLSGSFYKLGDQLRIDARLEDAESGEILLGEKVVGSDPFTLVDSLTEKIALSLHLRNQALLAEHAADEYGGFDLKTILNDPEGFADSINEQIFRSLRDKGVLQAGRRITEITSSSMEAYKYYILGMEKFNLGLHDEAIERFEQAIEIDSTFALPYLRIGMSNVFQGRQQPATTYLTAALRFQNKLPVRERTILDIYADTWLHRNFDVAFAKLESFVGNYPDDKEARTFYALFLSQIINNPPAAFAQLDTVLLQDPRYPLALTSYAETYQRLHQYDRAIEYFQRLKSYHPDMPSPYESLMSLYLDLSRYDDAMNEAEALLKLSPDNYSGLSTLVRFHILKRDFEHARESLERIRTAHGDDPYRMITYYRTLANLATWQGRFKASLKHQFEALELSQSMGDSSVIANRYRGLSGSYFNYGMLDSALYYLQESAKWATALQKIYYPLSLVGIDPGRADEAREIFREAANEFRARVPNEFWILLDDIQVLFEGHCNADTAALIAVREKLLERPDQQVTGNFRELGVMMVLTGRYAEGRKVLQNLLSGPTETTNAFSYLTSLYYIGIADEALGDIEQAEARFREILQFWGKPDIELKEIKDIRERLSRLAS